MNPSEQIRFGVFVPTGLVPELKELAQKAAGEMLIDVRDLPVPADRPGINFDPALGTLALVAFKFVGTSAASAVVSLVIRNFWEKLRGKKAGEQSDLVIALPSGKRVTLRCRQEIDWVDLEKVLQEENKS